MHGKNVWYLTIKCRRNANVSQITSSASKLEENLLSGLIRGDKAIRSRSLRRSNIDTTRCSLSPGYPETIARFLVRHVGKVPSRRRHFTSGLTRSGRLFLCTAFHCELRIEKRRNEERDYDRREKAISSWQETISKTQLKISPTRRFLDSLICRKSFEHDLLLKVFVYSLSHHSEKNLFIWKI